MAESSAKRPAVDRLDGPDDGKRLRQNSPPPQNVEELPSFHGKIVQRGENGYQAATYQYASSGNLGVWGPSAVIYAAKDNDHSDIKKAIDYAVQHKVSIAVRSGGHQYLGFSSTTDQNIQIDMSEYDYWDDSNVSEEKGSTLIMGPKWRLSEIAKKCAEVRGTDVYQPWFYSLNRNTHVVLSHSSAQDILSSWRMQPRGCGRALPNRGIFCLLALLWHVYRLYHLV